MENNLDCIELESMKWLLNQKSKLESRVVNAKCSDGTHFWDTDPNPLWCQIDQNDLICDANYYYFNITAEFEYLSQNLTEDQKKFENLIIMSRRIEEIPGNVFQDLSFNYVEINARNLKKIHTKAFNNNNTVSNVRKRFYLSSPNQLRNEPPDYDIWKAFSSLVYINYLEISLYGFHEIPDNAFEPINGIMNDLKWIVFYDSIISRIGSNAFADIPNLNQLLFKNIPLMFNISAKAFDFKTNSTQPLNIYFTSCGLSETGLEEGVFSDAKRPLNIDFSMN